MVKSWHVVKSLQLIWKSGTRRFHLQAPNFPISCSDTRLKIELKNPIMTSSETPPVTIPALVGEVVYVFQTQPETGSLRQFTESIFVVNPLSVKILRIVHMALQKYITIKFNFIVLRFYGKRWTIYLLHYDDVIMGTIASLITSLTIVYSTVYSDADQRKHQSSASLAFVWGIHRGPVNSPHKWPVTRIMFSFDDVIM